MSLDMFRWLYYFRFREKLDKEFTACLRKKCGKELNIKIFSSNFLHSSIFTLWDSLLGGFQDPKKSDKEIAVWKMKVFFLFPDILMCDNHDLDCKIKGLLWNSMMEVIEFQSWAD